YEEGSIATLTATPDPEWIFLHWIVNEETLTTNPLQITVDGDKDVVAVFQTTESITEHIVNPLVIYPNPAKDFITVELPANSQGVLQVFDSKGVMVSEIKNDIISSHQKIKLDVSSWADGIYIVVLNDQMKRSASKISIQK
ncbi:MAG: T9SS type A sorting domain-containing protein, partial [Bacteroidales bacterium]|nr:T9SS type A sorting domain-containing protein [Bacteroidales bacterium]